MSEIYDAVICGAGPAGATTARILAGAGTRVLLVDRSAFPRHKLCGGVLTHKSMLLLSRVFGVDSGDLLSSGAVDARASEYSIRHKHEELVGGSLDYPLHFANRLELDQRLLDLALAAGAQALLGESAERCDPMAGTLATKSGRMLKGRYVVGADGAASVVRRSMPEQQRRWRKSVATGIEVVIADDGGVWVPDRPVLHFGFVDQGYGWIFPTGHGVVVGLCGLNSHNNNFLKCFDDYVRFLQAPLVDKPLAHMLPYGNYLTRPWEGRALLAGDAAGYADCLLGEGLYYAMRSGEAAGHAILAAMDRGVDVGQEYARRLKIDVLDEIRATERWRRLLFVYQNNMRPLWPVTPLLRVFGDTLAAMVQGERSFSWGRRRDIQTPA